MMNFASARVEESVASFCDYFDRVNYPVQPLSSETKAYFNTFFGGDGFVTFCNLLFGPYHETYRIDEEEMCWMDYANLSPSKGVAARLLGLIHPSSTFISAIEALSIPPATFAARLKSGWKNSTEARTSAFYSIDLPLSALFPQFFQLMGEPADANLHALPRSRCPPILLVPFWDPPVVTRKEASQQQVMTSLPCSPMGYFLLRLFLFGMRRVQRSGAEYVSEAKKVGLVSWLRRTKAMVFGAFYRSIPVEMPFYAQIVQSYIQVYVSAALPRHLGSKSSITDVAWTTNDVTATVLLLAPTLLAHRHLLQPASEETRFPCTNAETLAQVLSVVPLHTSMVYAISDDGGDSPFGDGGATAPLDFALATSSKAQTDLEHIRRTLYRNCLTVLREALLSLSLDPYCKAAHFTYCLELWAVLMNPFEKQQRTAPPQYVAHHFEAFSYLTADVLNMIVKSSFVCAMTEDSARVLKKCFLILSHDAVLSLLSDVNASQSSSISVADTVCRHFVLNWAGSDGNVRLLNLHGETTCNLAARAYVALEKAVAEDVSSVIRDEVRETLAFMERAFPRLPRFLETWRAPATALPKKSRGASTPAVTVVRPLSESEKRRFFKGGRVSQKAVLRGLRVPTHDGRVPGSHDTALQVSFSHESPSVVGFSRLLDAFFVFGLELWYSRLIPKCDRGHNLWLTYSRNYACVNHHHEPAIWECKICETVYGSCCRGLPSNNKDERLQRVNYAAGDVHQCCACGQVVPENSNLFFSPKAIDRVLCPDCASRPYQFHSCRWIASYTTWAMASVALLFFLLLYFLF